jgi:hypothetical protein
MGEFKTIDFNVTLSPLALSAFSSRTGTLGAPGIWMESDNTPTAEMATTG